MNECSVHCKHGRSVGAVVQLVQLPINTTISVQEYDPKSSEFEKPTQNSKGKPLPTEKPASSSSPVPVAASMIKSAMKPIMHALLFISSALSTQPNRGGGTATSKGTITQVCNTEEAQARVLYSCKTWEQAQPQVVPALILCAHAWPLSLKQPGIR